jgi:amidase
VLTRSVRDSALMLDLTVGPEATSRTPVKVPEVSFTSALTAALAPLRIGVCLTAPGGMRPNAEIGAVVERTVDFLARAGHRVNEFVFPDSANIGEAAAVIWLTAIAEEIDFYRVPVGRPPEAQELEALSWAAVALGKRCSAVDYVRARRALTAATRDMAGVFAPFDLLILPTTAELPVPIGHIDGRTAAFDMDRWNSDSYGYAPYTEIFNVTGQPAISLPLGMSVSGLPIGVQFVAPLGEDALLLTIGAWLERELPWAERLAALRRRWY